MKSLKIWHKNKAWKYSKKKSKLLKEWSIHRKGKKTVDVEDAMPAIKESIIVTLFMAEASYVTALVQQYLTFSEIL